MRSISPRFMVGWMVITPRALFALLESQEDPRSFVHRHVKGDWGDVVPEEWAANEYALTRAARLFSVYHTRHGRRLFVLTEGNRYATTILTPEDYATHQERSA